MSEGLIGAASSLTSTSPGPGLGVGTRARDRVSSPAALIMDRICRPVSAMVSDMGFPLPVAHREAT